MRFPKPPDLFIHLYRCYHSPTLFDSAFCTANTSASEVVVAVLTASASALVLQLLKSLSKGSGTKVGGNQRGQAP